MKIESSLLKTLLPILASQQMDELTVHVEENGWRMGAMSPDRVTLVVMTVSRTAFTEYPDLGDEPMYLSFDISKMLNALKGFSGEVELRPSQGRMTVTDGSFTTWFGVPLPNTAEPRVPTPELGTSLIMSSDDVRKVLSASDYDAYTCIRFKAMTGGVELSIADESKGTSSMLTPDVYENTVDLPDSYYPVTAVERFFRTVPKGTLVEMRFGQDLPLLVTVEDEQYRLMWMVAPHIGEDD